MGLPDLYCFITFQSTLPGRERPRRAARLDTAAYFNPRSREGSDLHRLSVCVGFPISIHAPGKGATR